MVTPRFVLDARVTCVEDVDEPPMLHEVGEEAILAAVFVPNVLSVKGGHCGRR
jgi:hypothetical protein